MNARKKKALYKIAWNASWILVFIAAVAVAVGVSIAFYQQFKSPKNSAYSNFTSLYSLSPHGQLEVQLQEKIGMDRNFALILIEKNSLRSELIFKSPDEGRPPGTERVLWSTNSDAFILIGKHFFLSTNILVSSGEALYLLYDIREKRLYCNSSQFNGERFNLNTLKRFGFSQELF